MPTLTADQVDKRPFLWDPQGAMNLPEIWYYVDRHRPAGFALPTSVLVTIFYEETGCCNILQDPPAAIGPGQLQVSEAGKIAFFACQDSSKDNFLGSKWDSSMTLLAVDQRTGHLMPPRKEPQFKGSLPLLTRDQILHDNEFSVKMHVKFFQWFSLGFGIDGQKHGLDGILKNQAGDANAGAVSLFMNTGMKLEKLMQKDMSVDFSWSQAEWKSYYARRRKAFRDTLNEAKAFKGNQIPERFDKYWEYLIPDDFLPDPLGYVKYGF